MKMQPYYPYGCYPYRWEPPVRFNCCPPPIPIPRPRPRPGVYFCLRVTDCDSGAPLPGAVVQLHNMSYPQVQNLVSDAYGMVCFYLNPCNSYQFAEQSAPSGYELNAAPHILFIDSCGNVRIDGSYAQTYTICNRKMIPPSYSVVYNPNGGSGGTVISGLPSGTLYSVMTDTQAGVSFPGQTFIGWNTSPDGSGITYMPGSTLVISENVTLYAQWQPSPVELYSVVYNPNGGGGGFTDGNLPAGSLYMFLDATEASVYRFNYDFVAWNTASDGSGTTYLPGDSLTLTSNLLLYAQWQEIPPDSYSVTYDANGGSGGSVIPNLPSGTLYPVLTDTQAGVSFPGQTFIGWNTMPDGSGSSYMPTDIIMVLADITLYAQWV